MQRKKRTGKESASAAASAFIALLARVADIEHMIVEGLDDAMPCKKKHIYREQAFRQAVSLATTHFKHNNHYADEGKSA